MKRLLFLALTLSLCFAKEAKDPIFFEKPYLQLGDRPALLAKEGLELMWIGHDKDVAFRVEYGENSSWKKADVKMLRRVATPGTDPHRVFAASLLNLKPGAKFNYRIFAGDKQVFESSSIARKKASEASHFVVFGDCSVNSDGQKGVAYYAAAEKPDYVFITGDIVYNRGRVSEYQEKFWPIYNSDKADPKSGSPLLRSTLLTGVVGNHDVSPTVDFDANPDPLAYYLYWSLPLNGPKLKLGDANVPKFKGNEALQKTFLETTPTFPTMANHSFDYGNVHWTVLDANPYTDWTTPAFREWVRNDLKAASKAGWRVVGLHHPPFNSSKAHFNEQRMRVLSDIFEEGNVSIVFAGHVHNYQRTHPMQFKVEPGFVLGKEQKVPGTWTLDKSFDGSTKTKPNGVIYIVTGAGGAGLYNTEQHANPSTWQEFTKEFVSDVHSFTVVDADKTKLKIRQVSAAGKDVDTFTITK
jgi:acid phosphatase type 7